MKLSDYKQDYYEFSGKASNVARYAAFAGIALVWVFKVDVEPIPRLPTSLLLPTALLALGLALDLLHYVTATLIWGLFHWYHERKLDDPAREDPTLGHPPFFEYPLLALFGLKLLAVILAYAFIGMYVWGVWIAQS